MSKNLDTKLLSIKECAGKLIEVMRHHKLNSSNGTIFSEDFDDLNEEDKKK